MLIGESESKRAGTTQRWNAFGFIAIWWFCSALSCSRTQAADDSWESTLAAMPLGPGHIELQASNCVDTMLRAFQSNAIVKALIFMPGATDEFYMFRRARAAVTNANPSLLDAIVALTNQTFIKATFVAPFLLLHSDEDSMESGMRI